jgi:hypothetical protein
VNVEEEADVVPSENGAKDLIELEEVERVGHGRTRMTMGLTLWRTARRINRLKGACMLIPSGYLPPCHQAPRLAAALQMDRQHEEVREVEQHVADLLVDPPQAPDSRWLNEVRLLGTELHDLIQHHIVEEEDHLFRLAESWLTAEDQEHLAVEMVKVHDQSSTS